MIFLNPISLVIVFILYIANPWIIKPYDWKHSTCIYCNIYANIHFALALELLINVFVQFVQLYIPSISTIFCFERVPLNCSKWLQHYYAYHNFKHFLNICLASRGWKSNCFNSNDTQTTPEERDFMSMAQNQIRHKIILWFTVN